MNFFKSLAKAIFSDYLINKISGMFYGWHGDYKTWEEASSRCSGYDQDHILDKVFFNALRVKNGEIPYERDSVSFSKKIYSFPLLSSLMWIATQKNSKLNIIDFGGALGTSYYQNLEFLKSLKELNWCIVEQNKFVERGIKYFSNDCLHFYTTIDDCLAKHKIDSILLSSVIQYIEKPYALIEDIISKDFEYIIIDRTLLSCSDNDRLTVQKVPKKIYNASYCCWFLNEQKLKQMFSEKYDLILDFDIPEKINIKSKYKGFLFKNKLGGIFN